MIFKKKKETMDPITLYIPPKLILSQSIDFIRELKSTPESDKIIFDFKFLKIIDPFSLLFVSSEIHRYRHENKDVTFIAKNYENCTYPAHMGFFQSFGVNFGNNPGQAKGNNNYIPLTIYDTQNLKKQAGEWMMHPSAYMEKEAKNISSILTREEYPRLNDVMSYCIREIFRNVLEHSESAKFAFCAQFLPSKNIVEFAILDRGIGLKESLKSNPKLNLINDTDAILQALQPSVSGKIYKGQKNKPKGDWANSGFGLYMTSNICKQGGDFFITSGSSGCYLSENKTKLVQSSLKGTALNLKINTAKIQDLNIMLQKLRSNEAILGNQPSISSMGLIT